MTAPAASSCRRERHLEVVDPADLQRLKFQPQLPGCRLGVLPEKACPVINGPVDARNAPTGRRQRGGAAVAAHADQGIAAVDA